MLCFFLRKSGWLRIKELEPLAITGCSPTEFDQLAEFAKQIGFSQVASGPLVRSSYHADKQAKGEKVA